MQNAECFKGTGMSVSKNYCELLRRNRQLLWEFKTDSSDKVKFGHDMLLINDMKYTYDDTTTKLYRLNDHETVHPRGFCVWW